ncbi:MAG: hypothetical protein AB1646_24975 [Thermodesulfobacteriota bacterium]
MKLLHRAPILLAILFLSCGPGCTERQRQDYSHWKSDVIGLNRTVTLYDASGKPIRTWKGRFKVEIEGATARFIADGKAVIISGPFVIEEN